MIPREEPYRGFIMIKSKPSRKTIVRIFKNGEYKATLYNFKDAMRVIDFCLRHNVRGWK